MRGGGNKHPEKRHSCPEGAEGKERKEKGFRMQQNSKTICAIGRRKQDCSTNQINKVSDAYKRAGQGKIKIGILGILMARG